MAIKAATERRPRGRPRREEADARQVHILDVAAEIFMRFGYGGASIDRIAAAARVGKPTLYARFGSKANLLKHVVQHMLENRISPIDDIAAEGPSGAALQRQLANIIAASIDPTYLGVFRLFLTEADKFPEIFTAFYTTMESQSKNLLINQIKAHPEAAQLLTSPEETAATLLDMTLTLVTMASVQPSFRSSINPATEASRIVEVVLHGLVKRPGPG